MKFKKNNNLKEILIKTAKKINKKLGFDEDKGFFSRNTVVQPSALYVGGMGSGKSMAMQSLQAMQGIQGGYNHFVAHDLICQSCYQKEREPKYILQTDKVLSLKEHFDAFDKEIKSQDKQLIMDKFKGILKKEKCSVRCEVCFKEDKFLKNCD